MISRTAILATGAALALALPAGAVTVTITTDATIVADNPVLTPHVLFATGGTVNGAEVSPDSPPVGPVHSLDGVTVSVRFADSADIFSTTWITRPSNTSCGWARLHGSFQLGGCNDTFSAPFRLVNLNTTSTLEWLEIDLRTADAPGKQLWFDITEPSYGTPDSYRGRDFTFVDAPLGDDSGTVAVEYSVIHGDQLGDAWRVMTVDFTGLNGGGVDDEFRFRQDVDSVIPVPAALPLLITGLGMLGFFRRRRTAA